jgi:hypothetical protein
MPDYLLEKLNKAAIVWTDDLRVAFGVRKNACAILQALPVLYLGGRRYSLSPDMIAVNRANYPDASRLHSLFQL